MSKKSDQIPDQVWNTMAKYVGYTDEEAELFRNNPKNAKVMAVAAQMRQKTIVFEVIESHGCNSQHRVGTRFFFTGDGNLISKMAPSRVCAYALPVMTQAIFGMQELWYAGKDPGSLTFSRGGCFDVGVRCSGWGRIVVEASVMDRQEAEQLHAKGHTP